MHLGIRPTVDYAFKKVFGTEENVPVLASLLNAVLKPPPERLPLSLAILNPFNEKDAPDDKLSILDIKARDQQGQQYNIEMQMVPPPTYPQRILYYWAVLYGGQLREGENFDRLQPTISISFVNGVLFPKFPEYHLDFQLRCSQHLELALTDRQSVHLIQLPKFTLRLEELTDDLDAWCYFLVHGASLDPDDLPVGLRIPAIVRAMEVLRMLAKSDLERERYEARLKEWRDRASFEDARRNAEEARTKAEEALRKEEDVRRKMEDALRREEDVRRRAEDAQRKAEDAQRKAEDAQKETLAKGNLLGRIHICERLLKRPLSASEELLALPVADLKAMAVSLERQAGLAGP